MSRQPLKTPRSDSVQVAALMAQGNLEEALGHARALLADGDPSPQVSVWATECERLLEARYLASVGGEHGVLEVRSTPSEQMGLPLSPASAFLISLLDGYTTVDEVLDVSGLPRLDALRGLAKLVESGAAVLVAT